jgi:hypothetical protein
LRESPDALAGLRVKGDDLLARKINACDAIAIPAVALGALRSVKLIAGLDVYCAVLVILRLRTRRANDEARTNERRARTLNTSESC